MPIKFSVGWLDFSDEDRRKAREYLRSFEQEGTLDELGFGILRDSIADIFFPATSTIMTRARYLIFLPTFYLIIEHQKVPSVRAQKVLKSKEDRLCEILSKNEKHGVIGSTAKERLRRYPSSIYWNSLKKLGIFRYPGRSQSYYHSHLDDFYERAAPQKDDDGLIHMAEFDSWNWDKDLSSFVFNEGAILDEGGDLRQGINFRLTKLEASYLEEKFRAQQPSLLSHLIDRRRQVKADYPWDLDSPAELKKHVTHAELLSILAKGATLVYYELLLRARRPTISNKVSELKMDEPLRLWWAATRQKLRDWDIREFQEIFNPRADDLTFIKDWHSLCIQSKSGIDLMENEEVDTLIKRREKSKRPGKARFAHDEYLRQWNPPASVDVPFYSDPQHVQYLLDYRCPIGVVFVNDIVRGLSGR